MKRKSIRLIAILALAATHNAAYAESKNDKTHANVCQGVVHEAVIEESVVGKEVIPVVIADIPGYGRNALIIGAGASDAVVFTRAEAAGSSPQVQSDGTDKDGDDFIGQQIAASNSFHELELPPAVEATVRQRGIDGSLNPQTFYPKGYVVLNFKAKRLLEFNDKDDVAACVGRGQAIQRTEMERENNLFGIDGELDSLAHGRLFVDPGEFRSKFFASTIDYGKMEKATEILTEKGENVATMISRDHIVLVGSNQKKLSVIIAPTKDLLEEYSYMTPYYIALLGYDVLKDSILIIPPAGSEYWEIIF